MRSRLAKGWAYPITTQLKRIWQTRGIANTTKAKLLRALVWPVATYGCESWAMRKHDETKIRAFEMKYLRYVLGLRISCTEKRTNKWVMNKAETERQLLEYIRKRKLTYMYAGHMMRKKEESLEKEIIQGNMPGGRARGRPKMRWVDNNRTWTGMAMKEPLKLVENRQNWMNVV